MWQADLHGVAKVVTECLGVYYNTYSDGGQASDQPEVAGRDIMFISLSATEEKCATCLGSKMRARDDD